MKKKYPLIFSCEKGGRGGVGYSPLTTINRKSDFISAKKEVII